MTATLAAAANVGNPLINISVFAVFVIASIGLVIWAGRTTKRPTDFYTGGGEFSGAQNGFAISGDYLSAASFLGVSGAIAIYGYDGFLYSIGFLVAWLLALLLVAELLRNTGRFTMADVLSFRLRQRPVRLAAALSTLTVSLFYLLAQMAGAGGLVALLLDVRSRVEWEAGHMPGVENFPLGGLEERIEQLPEGRPLVVYCQGGSRSAIATSRAGSRKDGGIFPPTPVRRC